MTAARHLGPIGGLDLWWLLVTLPRDPGLPLHDHRPEDIPATDVGRRVYAVAVGFPLQCS